MKLEILFYRGKAGYIEENLAEGVHQYRFMPYRSLTHLALAHEIDREGKAEAVIVDGNKRTKVIITEMGVRHIVLQII